ncbi:MAG: glycoside hydrolase family 92 protein [Phaeodactylibacter sp.]|nr:glycoside hydrolase family 92 protein [Phaeodactylibacter sp.]MCB9290507.1 glycoside hydrolase family 92 protein [Lewinellaceae bacterium]
MTRFTGIGHFRYRNGPRRPRPLDVVSTSDRGAGRYLEDYARLGYVTSASATGASSRTLEYAYDDFCIKIRRLNIQSINAEC